jgi:hypothetical protein
MVGTEPNVVLSLRERIIRFAERDDYSKELLKIACKAARTVATGHAYDNSIGEVRAPSKTICRQIGTMKQPQAAELYRTGV